MSHFTLDFSIILTGCLFDFFSNTSYSEFLKDEKYCKNCMKLMFQTQSSKIFESNIFLENSVQ